MSVQRKLHAAALLDEDVIGLSWEARVVWAYLPCFADASGRMDDKPESLRIQMLPSEPDVDMEEIFAQFARLKFITRYKFGDQAYVQIRNWNKYQTPYKGEPVSTRPSPEGVIGDSNTVSTDPGDDQGTSSGEPPVVPHYISKSGPNLPSLRSTDFDREVMWKMVREKWQEAGFYPGWFENWTAAKKKFHAKIDFRNWDAFWQGLCWAVETTKQHGERKFLGTLCSFFNESKWKDQEPPEVRTEVEATPTDRAKALAGMGY